MEEVFVSDAAKAVGEGKRNQFLNAFVKHREKHSANYIEVVQSWPPDVSRGGAMARCHRSCDMCGQAGKTLPALKLFKTIRSNLK